MIVPASMWDGLAEAVAVASDTIAWTLLEAYEAARSDDLARQLVVRELLARRVIPDAPGVVDGPARELLELLDVAIAGQRFEPAWLRFYPEHLRPGGGL